MGAERPGQTARLLVIGYGNTLRRDDGVGPKVAEAVAGLGLPGVRALACPLLTPELAEGVSRAGVVIFVDAAVNVPREVQMRRLGPAASSQVMAHAASPATLLALARDVFGQAPAAWWLTIPAGELGIGEELSPLARHGFEVAVEKVKGCAAQTRRTVASRIQRKGAKPRRQMPEPE
jgi:hydrogenase maturation protease